MTTIKELIQYLQQFDPEKKVWVVYDSCDLFEPEFRPIDPDYMKEHTLLSKDDRNRVSFGDLLMEVG